MASDRMNRYLALGSNIGVLIGLMLLLYEVRQNADLMRAQISMDRTNTNMQILSDLSNGGQLIPIDVKLHDEIDGFPKAIGWSGELTSEERRRYQFWMFERIVELNNDWFLCKEGLMRQEICLNEVRASMRSTIHRFYELRIAFTRSEPDFVAVMQEFALLEGLPGINDDGSWQ